MRRPPVKLFEKVVLTYKKIAEIIALREQECLNKADDDNRNKRIRFILWSGNNPKWSFVRTISESSKDCKIKRNNVLVKVVKCLGEFRCKQTNELREFTFYQNPMSTHRGFI